jgi:hypothetical protein
MKYSIILPLMILVLSSCGTGGDSSIQSKEPALAEQPGEPESKEVPEEMLALNTQPVTKTAQVNIDEDLFGKFFCDRAEFYINKNPQNQLYSSKTNSITLYYLDNELRQTKHALASDISTFLLRDLGSFRMTGFDTKNRELIRAGKVVIKTKNGVVLNSKLDNFELRWIFDDKEIKYRVNTKSTTPFVYAEKVRGFEKEFKAIEKYCI